MVCRCPSQGGDGVGGRMRVFRRPGTRQAFLEEAEKRSVREDTVFGRLDCDTQSV
jgi:hypothetical protein